MSYIVPWAEEPNGRSLPLALHTQYGVLVLAFQEDASRWQEVFDVFEELLSSQNVTFKLVEIPATSEVELNALLHGQLPQLNFRVVAEGSDLFFWKCIGELAAGTLDLSGRRQS